MGWGACVSLILLRLLLSTSHKHDWIARCNSLGSLSIFRIAPFRRPSMKAEPAFTSDEQAGKPEADETLIMPAQDSREQIEEGELQLKKNLDLALKDCQEARKNSNE